VSATITYTAPCGGCLTTYDAVELSVIASAQCAEHEAATRLYARPPEQQADSALAELAAAISKPEPEPEAGAEP
jgi:hypothetical protein